MGSRKVSNPLALAVLALLFERPMHPYEMGRLLRERDKERSIRYNRGSLYMVVNQLLRAGFVAAQETVREGQRPERTVYALTDAGHAELHDWMRAEVSTPHQEFPRFMAALSLMGVLRPAEAAELLATRLAALTEQVDAVRAETRAAMEHGLDRVFLMEEEYRLALLDAERAFVANLIELIKQPDFGQVWHEFHQERP
ncbi:MAG: PadR family transcriptional regulator [Micromonosporaceae bacterium]|nr:PadR family transcriptional regulator [Micromonosporaceae bacterium]